MDDDNFLPNSTFPEEAGRLKKGLYVMISGHPCRITKTDFTRSGKHNMVRVTIEGEDLFTGKKYDMMTGATSFLDCPTVIKLILVSTLFFQIHAF